MGEGGRWEDGRMGGEWEWEWDCNTMFHVPLQLDNDQATCVLPPKAPGIARSVDLPCGTRRETSIFKTEITEQQEQQEQQGKYGRNFLLLTF